MPNNTHPSLRHPARGKASLASADILWAIAFSGANGSSANGIAVNPTTGYSHVIGSFRDRMSIGAFNLTTQGYVECISRCGRHQHVYDGATDFIQLPPGDPTCSWLRSTRAAA